MNQFDKNVCCGRSGIPPNCLASILPSIVSSTHIIIIESNSLAAIRVGEICLSFSIDTVELVLAPLLHCPYMY